MNKYDWWIIAFLVFLFAAAVYLAKSTIDEFVDNIKNTDELSAQVFVLRLDSARQANKIILLEKQLDVCKKFKEQK
jgi:alpha-L-arabinofuranosidase